MSKQAIWTIGAALWILAAAPRLAASPLDDARQAQDKGNWEQAVPLWKQAAAADRNAVEGYLDVLETVGDLDQLEKEAGAFAARNPGWDVPVIFQARALAARGEAVQGAELLERLPRPTLRAQAERGRILLEVGKRQEGLEAMKGVLASRNVSSLIWDRYALAQAAAALGEYEEANRLYQALEADSVGFLPARLSLAGLFQEKYQDNLAVEELQQAEKLSPNNPRVLATTALVFIHSGRLSGADRTASRLLELRPNDVTARLVQAQLALIADDAKSAKQRVGEVLDRNPLHLRARSLLAEAAYVEGDSAAYHTQVQKILAQDPAYLDVYLDLGRLLEMSRRYDECLRLYDTVLAARPDDPAALIAKGLLLMRQGKETEARANLEKGFKGDPFNIRAYNQLELLDKMDTFTAYRSPHFELRLQASTDSVFAPEVLDHLESIYKELTEKHGWEPPHRTIVELFPSHDWFSARVTGLPWVEGIPAVCFGDVVAMDSPRTLGGHMNWVDILRHEFGHVLALGMTDMRVPFWFTEGLSVTLEHFPRGPDWDKNLRGAYEDGRLVGVDSLTIAFTRPRYATERLLAYHESSLIIADLVQRKGWPVIPKLLTAFGQGKELPEALKDAAGEDYGRFTKHAMEVIRAKAASIPLWPDPEHDRLTRLDEQEPFRRDDPAYLAERAVSEFQFGMKEEAARTAKELLAKDPKSARAEGILGLVAQVAGDQAGASEHLERAAALGSRDLPVHLARAEMALAAGDTLAAIARYGDALAVYPLAGEARSARAGLYAALGDTEQAREDYRTLITTDASAAPGALALARLEIADGNGKAAESALGYAGEILPQSATLEALEGRVDLLQGKDRAAYDRFLAAKRIDLKCIDSMVGMAFYYLKQKDYEEAAYFAELALRYQPDNADARHVLETARAN